MRLTEEPVLICDLDGTILAVNSFPRWVSHIAFGRMPRLGLRERIRLSLRAQILLLRRKSGRIDHARFMRDIQHAWHDSVEADDERMRALLLRRVRPALRPLLREIAAGDRDAVLATAAAGEYAIGLGRDLGFRHVLATGVRLKPGEELNSGQQKLLRVRAFLENENWHGRPLILLTDHIDDLPLARHCAAVGWFGSAAMLQEARTLAEGVAFIDCHGLDPAGISRALSDLSAHVVSIAVSGSQPSTLL
jgi:phosphoserine phosphatase